MFTEEQIRKALDGHFYALRHDHRGTAVIDLAQGEKLADEDEDALPVMTVRGTKYTRPNSIDWSTLDDRIIEMRRAGVQYKEISRTLGLNKDSVRWRWLRLCDVLGMDPDKEGPNYKKYNPQIEAEIVEARNKGETFKSIGKRYGMSKASACTLYYRWVRRFQKEAA